MTETLKKILAGKSDNHILPFFWQHGEDDETLLCELEKIYESGIRAVCVESRPAKEFGQEGWFEDMRLLLARCRELGMEFWLLDDMHFPTGTAAGVLAREYPELGKHAILERHTDVVGPQRDAAVLVGDWLDLDDRLIGVVACERFPESKNQKMTGRVMDLTDKIQDGIVFFDVPPGCWRVFTLIDTPNMDNFIDPLREDSVDVLINAVYEPHYRELGEYFGSTLKGFFSDEPFIMRNAILPLNGSNRSKGHFPWNENVKNALADILGEDWLIKLPALWFDSETAAETRVAYMDAVSKLYRKCFSYKLGDWCRAHGVSYIGHIVEDDGRHSGISNAGGHYFRSLDGQDMAGIDVVLCQIVPGMTRNTIAVPCSYDISDHEFFHFGLAKLGSSHAHIQPEKHGRAMCEIFGAYGWAEGLPMMKWLTDHMLVRGINEFVPHAFNPKYPDQDCPPHFYAHGNNPGFRAFRHLMEYMNRTSTLLSDGHHIASAGILYHAEAEWSGGKYMKFEKAAKILTENQLDFDVIPGDYLENAEIRNGKFCLAEEEYPVLIVPYAEILPDALIDSIRRLQEGGVRVWFTESLPERTVSGKSVTGFEVLPLDALVQAMTDYRDITANGVNTQDLRFYHTASDECVIYFFTNEGIGGDVDAVIRFASDHKGKYILYDPMENRAVTSWADGSIHLQLEPYRSAAIVFCDVTEEDNLPPARDPVFDDEAITVPGWRISFAAPDAYDPAEPAQQNGFGDEREIEALYNVARENTRFAGYVRYTAEIELNAGQYSADLGEVGETAALFINGILIGEQIIPPYRYTFSVPKRGKYMLTVITASHLGYQMRDRFSRYLMLAPVGLLGPVTIRTVK